MYIYIYIVLYTQTLRKEIIGTAPPPLMTWDIVSPSLFSLLVIAPPTYGSKPNQILCYLDADGLAETNSLSSLLASSYVEEVCGGFYIDSFNTSSISESEIDSFYANAQVRNIFLC